MKTKGVPFWEQHLEHIVLGVAGLLFLGFTAMQFIGNPNAVRVGSQTLGPGDVDQMLEKQAREIAEQIKPDAPEPKRLPEPQPVLTKFQDQIAHSINPQSRLPLLSSNLNPGIEFVIEPGGRFVEAMIPAPHDLVTAQYFDTINSDVVKANSDLQKQLPAEPYDLTWGTVEALFDLNQVLQQFMADRGNARALPEKWHNKRVDVLDVRVERREVLADGSFGEATTLDPLPGRLSFRSRIQNRDGVASGDRDSILKTLDAPGAQLQVIQPPFYPTVNDSFISPRVRNEHVAVAGQPAGAAANPEEEKLRQHKSNLAKALKQRENVKKELKDNQCPENEPEAPPAEKPKKPEKEKGVKPPGGGMAPPSGGGTGFGGGPSSAGGAREGGDTATQNRCKELRASLKKINDKIAKLEQEIARLAPQEPAANPAEVQQKAVPVSDVVSIWAHDLTIVPGKTYQYRFIVEVYNPLFAHKLDLMPEQEKLAAQFTLTSEPSEWSSPITALPPIRVYVTDARPPAVPNPLGGINLGTASIEVFRYASGQWWLGEFNVKPGDRVGGERMNRKADANEPAAPIDFATSWFLLDVVEEVGADQADVKANRSAVVVLQSFDAAGTFVTHIPRMDFANPERRRLLEEISERQIGIPVAAR